jgi:hypothetical protein
MVFGLVVPVVVGSLGPGAAELGAGVQIAAAGSECFAESCPAVSNPVFAGCFASAGMGSSFVSM